MVRFEGAFGLDVVGVENDSGLGGEAQGLVEVHGVLAAGVFLGHGLEFETGVGGLEAVEAQEGLEVLDSLHL